MKKSIWMILGVLLIVTILYVRSCSGYKIEDDGKVYYNTWNEAQGKIVNYVDSADGNTFKVLKNSDYAIDRNHVYYQQYKLKNADPKSFVVLSEFCGKDKNHAYYQERIIYGAAGKYFELINGGPYGKDKKDYYYDTIALHADLKSLYFFEKDKYTYWAKDKNNYYLNENKNPLSDYKSFVKLNSNYAKDKFRVYFMDTVIKKADPITFRVTGDFTGEDKNFKIDGFQTIPKRLK